MWGRGGGGRPLRSATGEQADRALLCGEAGLGGLQGVNGKCSRPFFKQDFGKYSVPWIDKVFC